MLRPEDCKPGTLVECIEEDCDGNLALGEVYTISDFHEKTFRRLRWPLRFIKIWDAGFGLSLGELPEFYDEDGDAVAYPLECFRLVPLKRVEMLRALLVIKKPALDPTP